MSSEKKNKNGKLCQQNVVSLKACYNINNQALETQESLKPLNIWFSSAVSATFFITSGLYLLLTKSSDMNCQGGVRKWTISSQMSLYFKIKWDGKKRATYVTWQLKMWGFRDSSGISPEGLRWLNKAPRRYKALRKHKAEGSWGPSVR